MNIRTRKIINDLLVINTISSLLTQQVQQIGVMKATALGLPANTPFLKPAILEGRWLHPQDQNAINLGK